MFSMIQGGGRRLIVVDMENLVGGAVTSIEAATWVRGKVAAVIGERAGDIVVIGTGSNGCLNAGLAWRGPRLVTRDGRSGADLALLEVLDEGVENRFAEVVIVSGDHIFSERAGELAAAGLKTTAVGVRGSTSGALRLAAHETRYIPMTSRSTITSKDAA